MSDSKSVGERLSDRVTYPGPPTQSNILLTEVWHLPAQRSSWSRQPTWIPAQNASTITPIGQATQSKE